ncbi:hypothetical protein [Pseudonocardia sp. D17]|uniref:hypothetical protein n=1 Tax=Pseudonocardia sp. D17 TaxID=882661 RepID=UPI002B3A260E|nr:hypothetical protein PSD17_56670 [Pseudonocardia sp. D17]
MAGEPTHRCPGGCGRADVSADLFACSACWYRLPTAIRDALVEGTQDAVEQAHEAFARIAAEDAARRVGTIRYEAASGAYYQWIGQSWRLVTPGELDVAAWESSRRGTPNPFVEARRGDVS